MAQLVERVARFPRLRYMGSKYRLVPHVAAAFGDLGGSTALDAFSGCGVVGYTLNTLGYEVTVNDFLAFPCEIARAAIENDELTLGHDDRVVTYKRSLAVASPVLAAARTTARGFHDHRSPV